MGGSNRKGGRSQRTGQAAGAEGARGGGVDAVDDAAETATASRSGGKRSSNTNKPANTKSGGNADKGSKTSRAKTGKDKRAGTGGTSHSGPSPKTTTAQVAQRLPVREDEDRWTLEEVEEVRAQIEEDIAGLRREIERAESEIAERLGDPSDGAGDDQADTGAKTFEREHEMSLANNARDLLSQNERALGRIEAGTYGVCENCGNPVGKARLQAFPRAALCVTCKQREERR